MASIFSVGFRKKKRHRVGKFSIRLPLSVRTLFWLFQMICAGNVKVAPGKPQTDPVKLKISRDTGEAKFSLSEGNKSTGSCFAGSVTERCFEWKLIEAFNYCLFYNDRCPVCCLLLVWTWNCYYTNTNHGTPSTSTFPTCSVYDPVLCWVDSMYTELTKILHTKWWEQINYSKHRRHAEWCHKKKKHLKPSNGLLHILLCLTFL